MFNEGDLVEIPLPDGRIAIGWILHISQLFKDAVGFAVLGMKSQLCGETASQTADSGSHRREAAMSLYYTHRAALEHYKWKVYANRPISEAQCQLTRRQVGGGVYVGDKYIGSAKELGEVDLTPMLAMGMPVIYSEIEKTYPR